MAEKPRRGRGAHDREACATSPSRWKARSARRRRSARRSPRKLAQLGGSEALTLQRRAQRDRPADASRRRESQTRFALLEARMDAASARDRRVADSSSPPCGPNAQADPTTALPTARRSTRCLQRRSSEAAETRQPLSVDLCDLDYFAAFNENFGNHIGDQVLRSIGMLFKAQMRPGDMVGALRRRPVRRDPAAPARKRCRRLRGTIPPGADGARTSSSIRTAPAASRSRSASPTRSRATRRSSCCAAPPTASRSPSARAAIAWSR